MTVALAIFQTGFTQNAATVQARVYPARAVAEPIVALAAKPETRTVLRPKLRPRIDVAAIPAPIAPEQVPEPEFVTRANATMLGPVHRSPSRDVSNAVTAQVRLPIRLTGDGSVVGLKSLTRSVLAGFGGQDEYLVTLVVDSVLQKQTDAYIDVLLNTRLDEGDIAVPETLKTAEGRVDTMALLDALVSASEENAVLAKP